MPSTFILLKRKAMKLCDLLSRIDLDNGNPGEVIPISFNSFSMLSTFRKMSPQQADKLLTVTRSASKASKNNTTPSSWCKETLGSQC